MGISNLTGKRLKNVKQSAIFDHLLQCNCAIDFDDFSILATDCNKFELLLKESFLIKREKPTLLALITTALNGVIFRDMALKGPALYVCL